MNEEVRAKFEEYKNKQAILKGTIKLVEHSDEFDTDVLLIDLKDTKAVIKREDFDVKERKESLVKYVGATIKFVITDIQEDGTLVCSRKIVKEYERDLLIQKLNDGEEFEGKIVHILKFGAYLNVKGTMVVLKNMDFADDHTTVGDLHKVGDVIKVKLARVTSTKKILVQAVEKYCNPTVIDFDTFAPQQVVLGTIKTIKTWGCYVCIAPNLDALAPVPEFPDVEVQEGTKVLLKINKVDKEQHRIRGKVLKAISDESEFDFED